MLSNNPVLVGINVGNKIDFERRRDVKAEKVQSIQMTPSDWLKQLDTWEEFKEELKQ
jgi:hypothetical protein